MATRKLMIAMMLVAADNGAVDVLFGSATGLTKSGAQFIVPTPQGGARSGSALAGANFGAGAEDDLAVGMPGFGVVGASGAGSVRVFYGRRKRRSWPCGFCYIPPLEMCDNRKVGSSAYR